MNEEKNNQDEQVIEEQESDDETQSEYREISEEELKQILDDHKRWLESDGKEGMKAAFFKANLSKVNLKGVILTKANFQKVDLQEAKLEGANLKETCFSHVDMQNAEIQRANLERAYLVKSKFQKAYLAQANMQNANLFNVNLKNADLEGANLKGARLAEANMQNTFLNLVSFNEVNLTNADLRGSNLKGAIGLNEAKNLQYANFTGATGLLGNEFAHTDVTGTKLPDDIKEFKALEIIKETSQNARKIFFAMLLSCVYSWLTIATTTDVRLLTNTASSPLPIIGTEIPIAWFYIAAPLVLICVYFYFHLYLIKLWESQSGLPAIFPDGKRLDEIAYPWLLNGLVRRHFRLLSTDRPFIAHVQEWITIFLAWLVVPITMLAFWLRYIPRHKWGGTCFHIGLIIISIAFAIIFYRLCALTLQEKEKVEFRFKNFWKDRRLYYGLSVVFVGLLFSLLSYGAINGSKPPLKWEKRQIDFYKIENVVPLVFKSIGYDVFVNFQEKNVSEMPANYWEIDKDDRLESVKGANLNNSDLKNANMSGSFLVKADLLKANLQNAYLMRANLQKAYLYRANLWKAHLDLTNLQEVILAEANLQDAYLTKANLQKVNLDKANLQDAILLRANLQEATLLEANVKNADFWEANLQEANLSVIKNLTIEQLSKVKTLYQAKLDPDLMEQVKKCCPHLLEKPKMVQDKKDQTK